MIIIQSRYGRVHFGRIGLMKRFLAFVCVITTIFLSGCGTTPATTETTETTEATNATGTTEAWTDEARAPEHEFTPPEKPAYEVVKFHRDEYGMVRYPSLDSEQEDYFRVTLLIEEKIASMLEGVPAEAAVAFNYTVTLSTEDYFCLIYEGYINDPSAAHPSEMAFTMNFELESRNLFEPLDIIQIDGDFVEKARGVFAQSSNESYSDEEWRYIQQYFDDMSDEQLKEALEMSDFAFSDSGVYVCMSVPHAIGDYVKIYIEGNYLI